MLFRRLFSPVSIASTDDVTLAGKIWSSPDTHVSSPMLLFVHQYAQMGGQGALMEGMAAESLQYGFAALTFDLRGAGDSDGSCTITNQAELADVRAAIDYLVAQTSREIFLVGSSGGAPLVGAALDHSPRVIGGAMIGYVWGWWASWLFGWAYPALERSAKPTLFVVGDRDEFTSISTYRQRISGLPGISEMRLIEGKNHFEIEAPCFDGQILAWVHEFMQAHRLGSVADTCHAKPATEPRGKTKAGTGTARK